MSKKYKKQIKQKPAPVATQSPVSFSLNKWFKKIVTTHPSTLFITLVVIGFAVFMFGGGVYTLTTEGIMPSLWYNNRFYFLSPFGIGDQFIADTVISAILYIMGFVGLLSIYQSTKSVSKPRQAYMLIIIGISLVLLSYIFIESAMRIKLAGI